MAYRGRRENASRSSYIQESGFSFLKLFKGSQIHEFGVLEFVKKIPSALGGKSWGGFGAHHFFTGIVNNSRRNTAWRTVTGVGQVVLSIEPYTHKFMEIWGIFPENAQICQGKFGSPQIVSGKEIICIRIQSSKHYSLTSVSNNLNWVFNGISLYCMSSYCIRLHCMVFHCIIWHSIDLYLIICYGIAWYFYGIAWHFIVLHGIA